MIKGLKKIFNFFNVYLIPVILIKVLNLLNSCLERKFENNFKEKKQNSIYWDIINFINLNKLIKYIFIDLYNICMKFFTFNMHIKSFNVILFTLTA